MINFLSIIALGFFLGMRHATDPDHVIAVTTIVTRERKISSSAWIGAFWGIGHTITIFIVGAGIILFDLVIPPRLGLSMELAVGLMLILLGVVNVAAFFRQSSDMTRAVTPLSPQTNCENSEVIHSHAHRHGDYLHSHAHTHGPGGHSHDQTPVAWLDRLFLRFKAYRPLRPLLIGLVHGLAGSAAVALLVLATIRDARWAIAYLLVFGIGTIAGMMVITMSIASTFRLAGGRQNFLRHLAVASGLLSLGFGIFVAYHILAVNGLLSAHPNWVPQ
ncbi:MAG TPA: high-affinity nickel-transport family protein [Terriglobales bacterium]|nr:high-affinity nickel-transport family protein [Terriglobales bacterium]